MSITELQCCCLTLIATGTVTQRSLVKFNGAQATVQGEKVIGVAIYDAAIGDAMSVQIDGIALIKTGAAITLGASLITDSQGRAIPSTGRLAVGTGATAVTSSAANGAVLTGGDSPEFVFGDAMEAASGAGLTIQVLLRR